MMWKPTKPGIYRCGLVNREVWLSGERLMVQDRHSSLWGPVPDGPWSLLAPERQKGPPTPAQLERWQWWAIWWSFGDMWLGACRLYVNTYDPVELLDGIYVGAHSGSTDEILYSAPIQPDLSTGPLWVPLEVSDRG